MAFLDALLHAARMTTRLRRVAINTGGGDDNRFITAKIPVVSRPA
jgi:hypothetical protein